MGEHSLNPPGWVEFQRRLQDEHSKDLRRSLNSFVEAASLSPPSGLARLLHAFLSSVAPQLRKHPLWEGADSDDIDEALDCVECSVAASQAFFLRAFGHSSSSRDFELSSTIKVKIMIR